jgi:hypothetical protein
MMRQEPPSVHWWWPSAPLAPPLDRDHLAARARQATRLHFLGELRHDVEAARVGGPPEGMDEGPLHRVDVAPVAPAVAPLTPVCSRVGGCIRGCTT